MEDIFVTVTGLKHYDTPEQLRIGMRLICLKDYDNDYDQDAIVVVTEDMYVVGYIANSPYTVVKGTKSAGRIYDLINYGVFIEIMFITKDGAICKIVDYDIDNILKDKIFYIVDEIFEEFE